MKVPPSCEGRLCSCRWLEKYQNDKGWAVVAALDEINKALNSSVAAIALAWLGANPQVSIPIASARTVGLLEELIDVIELKRDETLALSK